MNSITKYVALAGVLLLGACGAGGSANVVEDGAFSSRAFTFSENFTTRIIDTKDINRRIAGDPLRKEEIDIIGYDYLESISFDIPKDVILTIYYLEGFGRDTLSADDGIFMINVFDDDAIENHTFVGILNTTNVGAPLTASATFTGNYTHYLFVAPGRLNKSRSFDGRCCESITLTADFDKGTLTGSDTTSTGDNSGRISTLTVNGQFGDETNTLSGSVSYDNPLVSDRTFTAPLSGMIGQDGAVGVFSNHENTSDSVGYTLGGGFVVD